MPSQAASLCYGVFGGIRGWVFSIINSNLLKRLRYVGRHYLRLHAR